MPDETEQLDRLADLYLTSDSPASSTAAVAAAGAATAAIEPASPGVELLLVGHLPLLAGLWLGQYADAVARREGPVGLVRHGREETTAEFFGLRRDPTELARPGDLRDLIEETSPRLRRWILRPPASASRAAWFGPGVDRITILTGADETAVVSAYRDLKELLGDRAGRDERRPEIAIVVLGAEDARAAEAAGKVRQTAWERLGVRVRELPPIPRMLPRGPTWQATLPPDEQPWSAAPFAHAIRRERGDLAARCRPRPRPDATLAPERSNGHDRDASRAAARVVLTPRTKSATVERTIDAGGGSDPGATTPTTATRTSASEAPAIVVTRAAEDRPSPAAPSSASRAGEESVPPASRAVPGVRTLPVTCPRAEAVELAVDEAGRLHLLAREDRLDDLRVAAAWARENRSILAMACRDHGLNDAADPRLHVVTSEPSRVARLHGTGFRLHVLAPVGVDGKTGWYAAPLGE